MGPDSAPQGGEAWKFYSSVRMMLRVFGKEKAKAFNGMTGKMEDMVTGTQVIAKLDKCKVSDSVHQEQRFFLRSGTGIDNVRSVLDIAVAYGVIIKTGGHYTWPGSPDGEVKFHGMEAMHKAISQGDLLPVLFPQVAAKMGTAAPQAEAPQEDEEDPLDDIFNIVPGNEKLKASPPDEEAGEA